MNDSILKSIININLKYIIYQIKVTTSIDIRMNLFLIHFMFHLLNPVNFIH